MMIKAIVFDMDDTLYKESDYVLGGFKILDKWINEEYGKTGFYEYASTLFNSGEKKYIFNQALEILGINFNQATIEEMLLIYRNHDPEIKLLEDARWTLASLTKSVKKGLISDGFYNTQKKKVEALKLEKSLDAVLLSDQYGKENWKPNPFPYKEMSRLLNCSEQECLYIGDNPQKDFVTANKLGWTTIHIKRQNGIYSNLKVTAEYEAKYQIRDLKELANMSITSHLFSKRKREVKI